MNLSELFYVDASSPSGLRWSVPRARIVKAGDVAGTISPLGYWSVRVNRREYQCHRVIWELMYGPIPDGMEIDHKNLIRNDNTLSNLRLASISDNQRNKSKTRTNTSGYKGVHWCTRAKKWRATIRDGNGNKTNLGSYSDILVAAKAYETAAHKYHGQFARAV